MTQQRKTTAIIAIANRAMHDVNTTKITCIDDFAITLINSLDRGITLTTIDFGGVGYPAIGVDTSIVRMVDTIGAVFVPEPVTPNMRYLPIEPNMAQALSNHYDLPALIDEAPHVAGSNLFTALYKLGSKLSADLVDLKQRQRWLRVTKEAIEVTDQRSKRATAIKACANGVVQQLGGELIAFPLRAPDDAPMGNIAIATTDDKVYAIVGGSKEHSGHPRAFLLLPVNKSTVKIGQEVKLDNTDTLRQLMNGLRGMEATKVPFTIDGLAQVTDLSTTKQPGFAPTATGTDG